VRADEEVRLLGVAPAQRAHHVMVRAAAEAKRGEVDGQAGGAEFGGDVVARRTVALRRRHGMTHTLERRDVAAQAQGELRALTMG